MNGNFAAMWFGDHAYLRSLDNSISLDISISAPDSAYVVNLFGERIRAKDGKLCLRIRRGWWKESPILYGYPKEDFIRALADAEITEWDSYSIPKFPF